MKKNLCFDLDGVICTTKGNNYIQAKPKKKVINFINKLSKKYYIIIFTARYMGRNNDNVKLAKKQGYELTYKQLVQWNLKFDKLLMGKPSYDFIIDDKGYGFKKNWYQNFKLKD
jgi:histidinol phosphatase-like enzyme